MARAEAASASRGFDSPKRLALNATKLGIRRRFGEGAPLRVVPALMLAVLVGVGIATFAIDIQTDPAPLAAWRAPNPIITLSAATGCLVLILGFSIYWRAMRVRATERMLARQVAELAQKYAAEKRRADAAEAAKSNFFAIMSHELRTPLNAIIGFSEVMEAEMFGPLGCDRYRGYCADIRASGERLRDAIGEILDRSARGDGTASDGYAAPRMRLKLARTRSCVSARCASSAAKLGTSATRVSRPSSSGCALSGSKSSDRHTRSTCVSP
jgi:signal transduction histidine kinase